jgi:hypothetical protein
MIGTTRERIRQNRSQSDAEREAMIPRAKTQQRARDKSFSGPLTLTDNVLVTVDS